MKKKAISLLLVAAMTATMTAGCGDKQEAADNTTAGNDAAPSTEAAASDDAATEEEEEAWSGTLTVWSPQEDQDTGWLQKECDAFNAAHPNWDVTFEYGVCAEGDAKATVTTDVEGSADVYMLANDNIPDCSDLPISEDADYVYICENETIHGTTYQTLPNTKGKILVSDQSSMFLSKPCNVSDYGVIYGGVQKNIGPAGMVIVIMREDLIREDLPQFVPTYMSYATHANNGSMYNTPNCWSIYVCGQVFKYLKRIGGLEVMAKMNEEKAKILYDFLDESKMFRGTVEKEFRSLMNVPFVTASKETDAEVVAATKAAGFDNLKGHKSVGGLRASIYNAMPKEGVVALVDFLRKYEQENYKG